MVTVQSLELVVLGQLLMLASRRCRSRTRELPARYQSHWHIVQSILTAKVQRALWCVAPRILHTGPTSDPAGSRHAS